MKKKLLIILFGIICALCCAFGLIACGDNGTPDNSGNGGNDGTTQTIAVESVKINKGEITLNVGEEEILNVTVTPDNATNRAVTWTVAPTGIVTVDKNGKVAAVAEGKATVTATAGGKSDACTVTVNAIHKHSLTLTPAKEEKCTQEGNSAYYTCDGCDKWFSDKNGDNEIKDKSSVIIAKKKHSLTLTPAKEEKCTQEGNSAYYTCGTCDKWFSDENGDNEIKDKSSVIIAKKKHSLTLTPAKEAECTQEGNSAYYTCGTCDKWFSDENGESEITDKSSVVIAKIKHNYVNGVCTGCKGKEPTAGLSFDVYTKYARVSGIGTAKDTDIVIPDEYEGVPVMEINDGAFAGCVSLTSVTIPDSVTSIGREAFKDCTKLTSITIPDSVIFISGYVFYGCRGLQSITIGNSVISIGNFAFHNCNKIEEIYYKGDIAGWCAISGIGRLMQSGKQDKKLYFDNTELKGSLIIPDGATSIDEHAFYYCSGLTGITIPDSVTSIGKQAFYGCRGVTSVTIGNGMTSIEEQAFSGCSSLTSLAIGNSVTSIGERAFYNCTSLTSVTIPDSVTSIGEMAFCGCTSLTDAVIGNSVTSIENSVFSHCTSLTNVVIGNSVASIGDHAFYSCTFTSITIPDSVTSIGEGAFQGCSELISLAIGNSVTSIGPSAFYECTSLTSVTIPDSVTTVQQGAFGNCTSLINVNLPDSITSIGYFALEGCTSLTSITIPEKVTSIANSSFSGCTSLINVNLPDSITSIGYFAFYNCTSLTSITFKGTKEQWTAIVKGDGWNSDTGNYTIHCTDGDIDASEIY